MKNNPAIVPRWFPAIIVMLVIFWLSSIPGDDLPNFLSWDQVVKKGSHMLGYGLLAISYLYIFQYNIKYYWTVWILVVLFAATDEFHQSFVIGRHASVFDVVIFDNLGAAFALWLHDSFLRRGQNKVN
jgi:VanZ family protein